MTGPLAQRASAVAVDPPSGESRAIGHLERGCSSTAERHIDLLREGYGISKIRSHLTELRDREVVASEYGHREAAVRFG